MAIEKIDTLVVGGGQAGLAMSEHLSANGVPHLVLERHRIAERWRSERWELAGCERSGLARSLSGPRVQRCRPERGSKRLSCQGNRCGLFRRLCKENFGSHSLRRRSAECREDNRSSRFPRGDFRRRNRGQPSCRRDRRVPASHHTCNGSRPARVYCRCTPLVTATPAGCPRAQCWLWDRVRRAPRSQKSSWNRDGASTFQWGRMTVRRGPIGGATTAGGWVYSASGTPRLGKLERSM